MDFRDATDQLLRVISHAELADRLGCSVASVRQARLDDSANAHRSPPPGWQSVIRELALERSRELAALADQLG